VDQKIKTEAIIKAMIITVITMNNVIALGFPKLIVQPTPGLALKIKMFGSLLFEYIPPFQYISLSLINVIQFFFMTE
jgi:hypothetical protein